MYILSTLVITFIALLFPTAVHAQKTERPPVACDQNEGIGSVFYDFDAIYIYYPRFMQNTENDPGFPDELKFDNFNTRLVMEIKKNFALCMKDENGIEKPIIIIPPFQIRKNFTEQEKAADKVNQLEIHNPRNLTLMVRGEYSLNAEFVDGAKGFGRLISYWYRPEASYKLSRLPLSATSEFVVLPPHDDDQRIKNALDGFFEDKRPRKAVDSNSTMFRGIEKIVK